MLTVHQKKSKQGVRRWRKHNGIRWNRSTPFKKKLRALPPKRVGKTRAEVVELLAGDIRKAMEKGHSPAEIRDILAGEGIQVPLSRLVPLLQKEERTERKKEEDAAPVQSETAGFGLFTMPEKKEG
jgi:hypothetical protein